MTTIARLRVNWSGTPGGPGVSTFYFAASEATVAPFETFFNSVGAVVPTIVSWSSDGVVDLIDDATGALLGTAGLSGGFTANASGGGNYSAPVGGLIRWDTGTVLGGKRFRGRTFIVPLEAARYDADGSLASGTVGVLAAAAAALLVAVPTLAVWHRPAPGGSDGEARIATFSAVPDKSVVLRSRRD
jgi:hypothetical protein